MERRRQELIETNLPLVEHLVLRVSVGFPRFVERQELVAAGMRGLTEAAEHFDFERGVPFAAYAARRIRGAVLDVARSTERTPPRASPASSGEIHLTSNWRAKS